MSKPSSTTAFLRWALVAPAIVFVGTILLYLTNFMGPRSAIGYAFPFIGIGITIVLCIAAPVHGFATRTAVASLLGALAGLVLAFMLVVSIL